MEQTIDGEIKQYLPLINDQQKEILLERIHDMANAKNKIITTTMDYAQYRFPVDDIKFDRGEMNGRK